ncbi:unnamed protein product [Protopolystoma xenopodis]|uniref:Kinesin light chain n=1 Tax=Protopolystoma xenopodis TaxID=117903 RepID=A0A448XQ85_9PLAT|nr:unnamed protein product [Protopolystoma xenopodis]
MTAKNDRKSLEALGPLYRSTKSNNFSLVLLQAKYESLIMDSIDELSSISLICDKLKACQKLFALETTAEKVNLGVEETQLIADLCVYVNQVQCERVRMLLQLDRLNEENDWLREEYRELEGILRKLAEFNREADNDRQNYKFLMSIRKSDEMDIDVRSTVMTKPVEFDSSFAEMLPEKMRAIYQLCVGYMNQGRHEVVTSLCTGLATGNKDKELTTYDRGLLNFLQGVNLVRLHREKDALEFLNEAIHTFEGKYGREHAMLANVLREMGHALMGTKAPGKAEQFFRRALEIKIFTYGHLNEETARAKIELAEALLVQNKSEEAQNLAKSALTVEFVPLDLIVAQAKQCMAAASLQLNKLDDAFILIDEVFQEYFRRIDVEPITQMLADEARLQALTVSQLIAAFLPLKSTTEIECLRTLSLIYEAKGNQTACELVKGLIKTE